MPEPEVNVKKSIKIKHYYHCFKMSDSEYVMFDSRMDIPIIRGSIEIMQGIKLPEDSKVWFYKTLSQASVMFQLAPEKTIDVSQGKTPRTKPPKKLKGVDPFALIYHHFRMSSTLSALYDTNLDVPVAYGSNQNIDDIKSTFNQSITVITYKDSLRFPGSFTMYHIKLGKAK